MPSPATASVSSPQMSVADAPFPKVQPWLPLIFCATMSIITLIGYVASTFQGGSSDAVIPAFITFMPMCFFFVSNYLHALRKENLQLRIAIDELRRGELPAQPDSHI